MVSGLVSKVFGAVIILGVGASVFKNTSTGIPYLVKAILLVIGSYGTVP
jgi:hypothetical protein